MANISAELAAIMAAVLGRDVRQSIHDAIDKVNKTSEVCISAGTDITGPNSSSTGFYERSLYINIDTWQMWKCTGIDTWQSLGSIKGDDGNGISGITGPTTVGLVDTYTINFTDGTFTTFSVTNGQNGTDGTDGVDGSKWYKGTALSGTGTSITGFPGKIHDFYLNSADGYIYTCTKEGGAMPPDAAEWDYVMTITGGGGSSITVIDNLTNTSSTDALSANQGRALNEKKIEKPASASAGQILGFDGTNWGAVDAPSGGGMLPYLYIDSEAGATVTVNQPDGTSITPTAAGSGHWECELTGGYGTYVIHSVLSGQGDATQSLAVDTVKEYHVTDTHYDYTINVTAPSGSTVRIVGGGETYTGTGTGTSQAFAVRTPSTTYTVTATQIMDGNTKTDEATVTSASTSGGSTNVTLSIEFGTINVTVAADFVTAGSTITCVKAGVNTISKAAASTLTFRVPETGEYTISGAVGGTPYSTTVTVTDLNTPESASLATMLTLSVDLYSAAADTVSYTDDDGAKTCITDTDGHATATIKILPTGKTITFTSSVALDPDNLDGSHYYSKAVSITSATTSVYVMPSSDKVLYWWGYKNNVESVTKSNGWGLGFVDLTFNTNMATLARTARNQGGIGTANPVSGITEINVVVRATELSMNAGITIDAIKTKYTSDASYYQVPSYLPAVDTWHYYNYATPSSLDGYLSMWSDSPSTIDWGAFWYE